jgi:inner membrane transporter RhtA
MAVRDGSPAQAVGRPGLQRVPPWALVVAGATSVQFGAALAATIFDELGPGGAAVLRLGFAAVILLAIWRPPVRTLTREQVEVAALFGLTLGVMNLLFYEALDRLPLGIAVTIEFVGPLGVAVVGSRRRSDLGWAALAAAGIVLLADPGGGSVDALGLAFILGAGACWAGYIVLAQRAGGLFRGGQGLALASVPAALIPLGPGLAEGPGALLHGGVLATGAAVAVLSSVVPYTLDTAALRRIPANVFGVLMSLEPAIAALAGFIVLGQALGAREVSAMACVVLASIGITRHAATPPVDPA